MSGEPDVLSGELGSLSGEPGGLSGELGALSGDPEALAGNQEALAERRRLLAPLPGDLAARVGALGRRSRPEDVAAVILDLLREREWPLAELATLLGRHPKYVREQYLQPMVRSGRVAMTRPEVPNDPEQGYRAVGDQL